MEHDYMKYDGRMPEPPYPTESGEDSTSALDALLEAKVARTIFLVMMQPNMAVADWDSGAVLGENNRFRRKIEMAAKLAVIDMTHPDETRDKYCSSGSDSSNLVMRLRKHALPDPHDEREVLHAPLLSEAADTIERLLVLATKHCPREHHDWQEILRIAGGALTVC